jgi:diadenosine tetraphosphate (Ap4A) HIT family hydrolase
MSPSERLVILDSGESPLLIARMPSGFAVMADYQYLPGYCLLLAYPLVEQLNDLSEPRRAQYLHDMALLGDAVLAATDCARINYGTFGNQDPFLHSHIWPRFEWENEPQRTAHPWTYSAEYQTMPEHAYTDEHHGVLKGKIRLHLDRLSGILHD